MLFGLCTDDIFEPGAGCVQHGRCNSAVVRRLYRMCDRRVGRAVPGMGQSLGRRYRRQSLRILCHSRRHLSSADVPRSRHLDEKSTEGEEG